MKHLSFLLALVFAFVLAAPTFAQTDCGYQPDIESDYSIGVSDVLAILGLFGAVDTDQDYIWDSLQRNAQKIQQLKAEGFEDQI